MSGPQCPGGGWTPAWGDTAPLHTVTAIIAPACTHHQHLYSHLINSGYGLTDQILIGVKLIEELRFWCDFVTRSYLSNKEVEQVRVTLKSSSELRLRFYSLEISSPLLDIEHGTWEMGHETWDKGHGAWDMGHGTWDIGHRT